MLYEKLYNDVERRRHLKVLVTLFKVGSSWQLQNYSLPDWCSQADYTKPPGTRQAHECLVLPYF